MSSPKDSNTWSDRRGLFQSGKILHEPAPKVAYFKPQSPPTSPVAATGAAEGSTATRRRSSASSPGMFGNLMSHKRGSEDYTQRRASIDEMGAKKSALGDMVDKFIRPQK